MKPVKLVEAFTPEMWSDEFASNLFGKEHYADRFILKGVDPEKIKTYYKPFQIGDVVYRTQGSKVGLIAETYESEFWVKTQALNTHTYNRLKMFYHVAWFHKEKPGIITSEEISDCIQCELYDRFIMNFFIEAKERLQRRASIRSWATEHNINVPEFDFPNLTN